MDITVMDSEDFSTNKMRVRIDLNMANDPIPRNITEVHVVEGGDALVFTLAETKKCEANAMTLQWYNDDAGLRLVCNNCKWEIILPVDFSINVGPTLGQAIASANEHVNGAAG